MKTTGVTIIRNAVKNDYPVLEAIRSILPVVDEMIVLIGDSDDNTEDLIKNISSEKIRIHHSTWDSSLRSNGTVLAVETNKVLDLVSKDADWIFYIQADEVVHEKYHDNIRRAMNKYLHDTKVEGLLFKYLHFYGTYDYVGDSREWYNVETRIIRNNRNITSFRDAQGFRIGNKKIKVAAIDAFIYHYGWVKSPKQLKTKQKNVASFWVEDDNVLSQQLAIDDEYDFNNYDSIKLFQGSHPAVMKERIEKKNWSIELDVKKKKFKFKHKLLYWVEKLTGKRLFAFRNHSTIRR